MAASKVASRIFLPMEIFLGFKLFVLGLTGGLFNGTLFRALAKDGENLSWLLIFSAVALPMIVVSVYEWCFLRRATEDQVFRSVKARSFLSLMSLTLWIGAIGYTFIAGITNQTMYIVLTAPVAAFFSGWSFAENLKVKYALDSRYPTSGLQFHR